MVLYHPVGVCIYWSKNYNNITPSGFVMNVTWTKVSQSRRDDIFIAQKTKLSCELRRSDIGTTKYHPVGFFICTGQKNHSNITPSAFMIIAIKTTESSFRWDGMITTV
jgi:hypothetical protein